MRKFVVSAAIVSLPALAIAGYTLWGQQSAPTKPTVKYSQERLDQIRTSLAAQIAVRDDAEKAMRAPTPEEAAALANTASGTAAAIALPGGGQALRMDASQLSAAVATIDADGTVRVTHDGAAIDVDAETQGGSHAR